MKPYHWMRVCYFEEAGWYIKNKKNKYGIKFYELCTPDGYLFIYLIDANTNILNIYWIYIEYGNL